MCKTTTFDVPKGSPLTTEEFIKGVINQNSQGYIGIKDDSNPHYKMGNPYFEYHYKRMEDFVPFFMKIPMTAKIKSYDRIDYATSAGVSRVDYILTLEDEP